MPTFAYVAKDKAGKIHRGRKEANNEKELTKQLQETGYWVQSVTKEGAKKKKQSPLLRFKKVKLNDLSIFCRQFATMINAGVSLVRCLSVLEQQTTNPRLKDRGARRAKPRRSRRNIVALDDVSQQHFQ